METKGLIQCPVCNKRYPRGQIDSHVNLCLSEPDDVTVVDVQPSVILKKRKSDSLTSHGDGWAFMMASSSAKRTKQVASNNDTVVINDCENSESTSNENSVENHRPKPKDIDRDKHLENSVGIEDLTVPLAEYMRPKTFDTYVGQEKAVGSTSILRSLLNSKHLPSLILWGPPGCGKTTLAKILANRFKDKMVFKKLSAVNSGVKDVSDVVKQAKNDRKMFQKATVLFLDEIHRFNKLQQDSLLPHIEDGTITLIGATTENPSFQVNNALLSRCKVIILEKLDCEGIIKILINAVEKLGYHLFDTEEEIHCERKHHPSSKPVWIQKSAIELLTQICDGDARIALNGLQMAVQSQISASSQSDPSYEKTKDTVAGSHCKKELKLVIVKADQVKQSLQKSHLAYDKTGEEHYNMLSAFHKSIRGSADSAALYWLARMLEGGESPTVVARRLVACATEDIGLADPQALVMAIAAFQACQFLGMPECEKALAECTVYLARAPKSVEVYMAYNKAKACVWEHKGPLPSVPLHLRNASNKFMRNLGYGKGYTYYAEDQKYLPECLEGTNFFWKTK